MHRFFSERYDNYSPLPDHFARAVSLAGTRVVRGETNQVLTTWRGPASLNINHVNIKDCNRVYHCPTPCHILQLQMTTIPYKEIEG